MLFNHLSKAEYFRIGFNVQHRIRHIRIVTGGSSGIGHATAKELVLNGANVIIISRSNDRGIAAEDRMRNEIHANTDDNHYEIVTFEGLDLSSFASVDDFVERLPSKTDTTQNISHFKPFNVVILNASIIERAFIGTNQWDRKNITG